ncbi:MAG: glycosyltransferase family 39 protein [Chloroflexota bacterium]
MTKSSRSILGPTRLTLIGILVMLFGLGLTIRLYDLTDLPLDFHPTRQLLSQLKARGMYYQAHPELPEWQRKMAIQQWKTKAEVEPEVFERLVAFTYNFTGPDTSVARVYSSLLWVIGSVFLFLLVREHLTVDAALVATAYFLFFPYAVTASRSFQPDVLMVMLILCFWWLFTRWTRTDSWFWTVLAGLAGGLAIYVKFVAAFFVIGAAIPMGIACFGVQMIRKRQLWLMAVLGTMPAAVYLYYGVVEQGFLGRQFAGRFIPSLLLSPGNYLQWAVMANLAAGGLAIALGLLGLLLVRPKVLRSLLTGLWIAYVLFGLFFDYHVATHDYYHLPLIAIVAVSAAPVAGLLMEQISRYASRPVQRVAVLGIFLYCVFAGAWDARAQLAAVDYRPQASMWHEIGERLEHGPNVVALTQDYGSRLAYWGWQNSIIWPNSGDIDYREARGGSIEFEELFVKLTLGNTYFLVTDIDELERQPALRERLGAYALLAQGDGYVIYDLESPGGS